jgi:outer membrane protein assembly factor BamB
MDLAGLYLAALLAASPAPAGEGWPAWRGAHRDGHAPESAAGPWPENLTRVWRVEAAPGLSSPVVSGERIYLLGRDGDDEVVTSLSLENGAEIWRRGYPAPFFANSGAINPRRYPSSRGKGPFATPAAAADGLFTLGAGRVLSRFDPGSGALAWRHTLLPADLPEAMTYICPECGCSEDGKEFHEPGVCPDCGMALNPAGLETSAQQGGGNYYGAAASPLVVGDLVVVHVGNLGAGQLMAFDARTGETRWESPGPIVGYASPVSATIHRAPQIVALAREGILGVSAVNGSPLWSVPLPSNAHVVTPLVAGNLVVAAEYRGPTFALRIRRDGDAWSAAEVWRNEEETLWLSSPVLDGSTLYGFFFSDKGHFAALDLETGRALWKSPGRQGESAALVAAGDVLAALRDDGTLVIFEKSRKAFHLLRTYPVADSPTWTHPVLVGDRVLVRDESGLTLWRRIPAAGTDRLGVVDI